MLAYLGWASLACAVGVVEAMAAYLDPRLGIGVAVALVGLLLILQRPALLSPIAIACVFLEGLTFQDVAVTRFLAPCALLLLAIELLRGTVRVRVDAPLIWALVYALWAAASLMWTESTEGTVYLLQSLAIAAVFMLVFAAFVNTEEQLKATLYTMAFTAAIVGGVSLIAFGGSFDNIGGFAVLQGGRSQGLVGDPDFFAAGQLVTVPLVLVLANETRSHRLRLILAGTVLALVGSAFTSLSRGAFLAILVLALLLVFTRPERLFQSRRQKAVTMLVATFGMALFFSRPYVRGEVVQRAETIYAPKTRDDESGSGRTNLWLAASTTAAANPVTGVGFGSFSYISEELLLRTPGVDELLLQNRESGENFVAHNTYLGTAAELGYTGLALFLAVVVSTGVMLRRVAARAHALGADFVGRIAHALLLGLATWSVTSIFLSGETARMYWVLVGLALALPKLLPAAGPARTSQGPRGHGGRPASSATARP